MPEVCQANPQLVSEKLSFDGMVCYLKPLSSNSVVMCCRQALADYAGIILGKNRCF